MIFDTHAHYDDKVFDIDREELLEHLFSSTVCNVINVGCSIETSKKSIELSKIYPQVFAAIGIHPLEINDSPENYIEILKNLSSFKKVVAIGEIGLDYHYDDAPSAEIQKQVFELQLKLAKDLDLPVIVHSRESTKDTMDILKKGSVTTNG